MNTNGRPNLNGLFNGTTAPDRSSTIADALGPKPVPSSPAAAPEPPGEFEPADAAVPEQASPGPAARDVQDHPWPVMSLINPVKAAERYFGMVQALLDVNREMAMGLAKAVNSISRRGGIRR